MPSSRVTLPVGEALLFSVVTPTSEADRWYVVLKNDVVYTVAFRCFPPNPEGCLTEIRGAPPRFALGRRSRCFGSQDPRFGRPARATATGLHSTDTIT